MWSSWWPALRTMATGSGRGTMATLTLPPSRQGCMAGRRQSHSSGPLPPKWALAVYPDRRPAALWTVRRARIKALIKATVEIVDGCPAPSGPFGFFPGAASLHRAEAGGSDDVRLFENLRVPSPTSTCRMAGCLSRLFSATLRGFREVWS